MAKTKIVGDALVITSELKLTDLELVQKYEPAALKLYNVDDNGKKNPCFAICVQPGALQKFDVTDNGITFRKASRDGGFAEITCSVPAGEGDVRELVAEKFGGAISGLIRLEQELPDVIEAITERRQSVIDCIEVI